MERRHPFDLLLRHRRSFLVAGLLATLLLALAAARLSFVTSPESILITGDPDLERLRDHESRFGTYEHTLVFVLEGEDVFAGAFLDRLERAGDRLRARPEVTGVRSLTRAGFPLPDRRADPDGFRSAVLGNDVLTPTLVSRNGRFTILTARLTPESDVPERRDATLVSLAEEVRAEGLAPQLAGVPAVRGAYASYIRSDLFLLPPLVGGLLAVLLFGAFRSVRVVVGLLGTVGVVAIWSVGILSLAGGQVTALTSILPSLIVVLGIATGVHVVAAHREERRRGADAREASRRAMIRMALPCGLTSLTTAVGFSSLVLAGIRDVREFGLACAVGSLLTFLLGVPFVGVLLSWDPGRRVPPLDPPLRSLARLLVRHPATGIIAGVVLFAVALAGVPRIETNTFLLEDVREGEPIHEATVTIDRELGGVIGFELVIESEHRLLGADHLAWLGEVERDVRALSGVKAVIGPHTLLGEAAGSVGAELSPAVAPVVLAAVRTGGGAETASSFLSEDLRSGRINVRLGDVGTRAGGRIRDACLARAREDIPAGTTVRVAGLTVQAEQVLDRLVREMARSTALALVVIFLLVSLLFRSLRIGALAMVPNLFPLLAAAGFIGYAGITVRSSIALIFAVALGIAVDDTIHMITGYRRERSAGRGRRPATVRAIRRTGRPVALTSLVLLVGFLAFTVSDFMATDHFGIVASVTIVAALAGDLVVLPALWLARAGRRNA